MKKVIFLTIFVVFSLVGVSVSSVFAIEEHCIFMFKEASEGGNIISKDDNVILISPVEGMGEEGVWGYSEGTWYEGATLNKPIIKIVSPKKGETVTSDFVEVKAKISCNEVVIIEGSSLNNLEIIADSIVVKLIDEEGKEIQGDLELNSKHWDWAPEGTQEVEILFTPYYPENLLNGVYTAEVYGEDTNGQSAKKVWKFIVRRGESTSGVYMRKGIAYGASTSGRGTVGDYSVFRNANWENYTNSEGEELTWIPYIYRVGQSGVASIYHYDEYIFHFRNNGDYVIGDYSLETKKGYKKAKLRIHIKGFDISEVTFNPFYLEVYIDGVKAGRRLIEESDICEEGTSCTIDIPLDFDAVKIGGNIKIELKTDRLKKENPIPGTFSGISGTYSAESYREGIIGLSYSIGSPYPHLILYEPEEIEIEEQPDEETNSGSFETMEYIFSEPKILSKLCIGSSLASAGDGRDYSQSKIIITPHIAVEDIATSDLTWQELETYIFTEPTEFPSWCCVDLPENTNANGVKYAVTIVSGSDYPPELNAISMEMIENEPPTTIHRFSGKDKNAIKVKLFATDDFPGVEKTKYSIRKRDRSIEGPYEKTGFAEYPAVTEFTIDLDEVDTIVYYSVDKNGAREQHHTIYIDEKQRPKSFGAEIVDDRQCPNCVANSFTRDYSVNFAIDYFEIYDENSARIFVDHVNVVLDERDFGGDTPITTGLVLYGIRLESITGRYRYAVGEERLIITGYYTALDWLDIGEVDWDIPVNSYKVYARIHSHLNNPFCFKALSNEKYLVLILPVPGVPSLIAVTAEKCYLYRDFSVGIAPEHSPRRSFWDILKLGQSKTHEITVENGIKKSSFNLAWHGSDLNLILYDPSGREINPEVAVAKPDIDFIEGDTFEEYTILDPIPGDWLMEIRSIDVPEEGEEYIATVHLLTNRPPLANAGPACGVNEGSTLTFDASGSYDLDGTPLTYKWNFGDGSTGTGRSPSHVYAQGGTYAVTLVVNDGIQDSSPDTTTVIVEDTEPIADFTATLTSGDAPLTVEFNSLSSSYDGITFRKWDFGDGETSNEQNPMHIYTSSGTFTISLTVNEEDGDTDIKTKVDYITVTVGTGDTITPTIISVTMNAYATIPDATIHVTVNATDSVGVTSVTADGASLAETGSIWEGDITAPSTTGDYTLTIRAEDAAGNAAETTVDYSVVNPSGSIGMGVDPRLTTVSAGDTALINIKLVSTENFDDIAHVYLTTEGTYPGYQTDLAWFNWTSIEVGVPAGSEVNVPLEVSIPGGESGYKMFYAKLESTKWTPTAMDTGILYII